MSRSTGISYSRPFVELELRCSLCTGLSVQFNTIGDYIKHLRLFHAHRPDFRVTCGINGCLKSYSNLGSFKNHVLFVHNTTNKCFIENSLEADQNITHDTSAEPNNGDDSSTSGDEDVSGYDTPHFDEDRHTSAVTCPVNESNCTDNIPTWTAKNLQKSSAHFLFGIKERYNLLKLLFKGSFKEQQASPNNVLLH